MVEYFIINLNVIEKIFHKICSKRRFMGIHVSNIVPRWLKELLRMCKTISTFKSIKLLQHCATKLLNCIHFSPKWHLIVAALCERREHKNFKNCYKSCAYIFSSSSIFFLIQSSAKHTNRLANRGLCVTNLLSLSRLLLLKLAVTRRYQVNNSRISSLSVRGSRVFAISTKTVYFINTCNATKRPKNRDTIK